MFSLERVLLAAATVALAASTTSCFAVTDLDRFGSNAAASGNFNDLKLTVRGFTSHVPEMFEYRIVDKDNVLQSRGIISPLGDTKATMFAPGAVPKQNGPFTLDFYADHDLDGKYGRDPVQGTGDHSWRIPLADVPLDDSGAYVIAFDHNTSFAVLTSPAPPIEIGAPATIRLVNVAGFIGKRIQFRIADASSKRVVALYRIPNLTKASGTIVVPGMIEGGVTYTVELYTDDNQDVPGSVRAFRMEQRSAATGLDLDFDPATVPEVQDAAPP